MYAYRVQSSDNTVCLHCMHSIRTRRGIVRRSRLLEIWLNICEGRHKNNMRMRTFFQFVSVSIGCPQNAVFTKNGVQLCLKNEHHHHHLPSQQIC